MEWLEEAKRIVERLDKFTAECGAMLYIESADDLPESYEGIKSVSFSPWYHGPAVESVLAEVWEKATEAEKLCIFGNSLTWKTICSLDLSRALELTFLLDGEPTGEKLIAPRLKSLCIFGPSNLTPGELPVHPVPHIDFSGMSALEKLELKSVQQVDPTDFRDVSTLKDLTVTKSDITDTRWLEDATYSLTSLYLYGGICDCGGVASQPDLTELYLPNSCLADVSPIESLKKLKTLDLRNSVLKSEGSLRSMGIENLIITDEDAKRSIVKRGVRELMSHAAWQYRWENDLGEKIDRASERARKAYSELMAQPFEARMRRLIQSEFERKLKRIDEKETPVYTSVSNADYRRMFIEECQRLYPFADVICANGVGAGIVSYAEIMF